MKNMRMKWERNMENLITGITDIDLIFGAFALIILIPITFVYYVLKDIYDYIKK